jgi:hypothetical protein
LLEYLDELRASGETWIALPSEVAIWWRQRSKMRLVNRDGALHIEGEGKHRARIAYATIVDGQLTYEVDSCPGTAKASVRSNGVTEELALQQRNISSSK